jgi:uncharacterized membrane protein/DNA-binding MarR family transcriptional regulator
MRSDGMISRRIMLAGIFCLALLLSIPPGLAASESFGDDTQARSASYILSISPANTTQSVNAISAVKSATYGFQLRNDGDTGLPECSLNLTPWPFPPEKWSYTFIPSAPFMVSPGETKTVLLVIYPAADAEAKRYTFKLQGTGGVPSNYITINLDIMQYADVLVKAPPAQDGMPGSTLEFGFEIQNTGNGKDRFQITRIWTATPFTPPSLKDGNNWTGDIGPGQSARKTVVIALPYDLRATEGDAGIELWMEVRSNFNNSVTDINMTLIRIPHVYDLGLGISPQNAKLLPGKLAGLTLTVLNLGNGRDNVTVRVLDHPYGTGWTLRPDRIWLNLSAGRSDSITLKVTAPLDAVAGNYTFKVTAVSSKPAPLLERTQNLTISVLPVHQFLLPQQNITAEAPVPPGGSLHLPFNITNSGNADDTVELRIVELPEKWNATLGPSSAILVRRGATEQATLNVQPSDDLAFSRAGDHVVRVRLSSSDGAFSGNMTFYVTVSPVFDWMVEVNGPSFAEVNLFLTRKQTFFLDITNTGNTRDDVSFAFGGPNASWGRLDAPIVGLAFGEKRTVMVGLEMPGSGGPEAGTYSITVNATSMNRPGLSVPAVFTVKLRKFDPSDNRPVLQAYPARQKLEISGGATTDLGISVQCRRDDVSNVTLGFIFSDDLNLKVEVLTPPGDIGPGENRTWILRIRAPASGEEVNGFLSVRAVGDNQSAQWEQIAVRIKAVPKARPVVSMEGIGVALAIFLALGGIAVGWNEIVMLAIITQFLPLYSKIRREEVLDQYTRGKIHGYIIANPGEHYNSLKAQLKLKNGTLAYHLRVLEREGYVKSARDGPFKRFYPQEAAVPRHKSEFSSIQEIVLENIRAHPGITQNDVARKMGVSSQVVNYHIRNLVTAGRIRLQREGRTTRCFLK